jgi:hypothetical protein
MIVCTCQERPRCGWEWCDGEANWSVWKPRWGKPYTGTPGSFKFMCHMHWNIYRDAMTKSIKGLTKPEGADEDWRPSLMDMIHHAEIAIKFEERDKHRIVDREQHSLRYVDLTRFTPAQLEQVVIHRKLMAKFRSPQVTSHD